MARHRRLAGPLQLASGSRSRGHKFCTLCPKQKAQRQTQHINVPTDWLALPHLRAVQTVNVVTRRHSSNTHVPPPTMQHCVGGRAACFLALHRALLHPSTCGLKSKVQQLPSARRSLHTKLRVRNIRQPPHSSTVWPVGPNHACHNLCTLLCTYLNAENIYSSNTSGLRRHFMSARDAAPICSHSCAWSSHH